MLLESAMQTDCDSCCYVCSYYAFRI